MRSFFFDPAILLQSHDALWARSPRHDGGKPHAHDRAMPRLARHIEPSAERIGKVAAFIRADAIAYPLGGREWMKQPIADEFRVHSRPVVLDLDDRHPAVARQPYLNATIGADRIHRILHEMLDDRLQPI